MNDYVAYDTETTYTKERDVRTLGPIAYVRHPETQCYLVSLVGDGIEYVGPPEGAPWDKVAGRPWVSHNRSFDKAVHNEMIRRGLNASQPAQWNCSADLMAYCQAPRALAKAASVLLGKHLNKQVRDDMRGKTWEGLTGEKQTQVLEYALEDSRTCLQLWDEWSPRWPEHERRLSRMTTEMGHRGIAVDTPLVESGIASLKERQFEIEQKIPWFGETNDKGKEIPISSPKALAAECRRLGIDPPESTDSKSDIFDKWAEENAEKAPFVAAIQEWRRTNRLLKVLLAVQVRTIDGIMPYELKYGGASHTMRWSGSSGLNMQNLPRKPYAGVDARALFIPRPGHKFVIADLAQIEARVLLWLAGDARMLELLRQGLEIYEAHARLTMGYTDPRPLKEVDNDMRQLAKCRCIARDTLILTNKGYVPIQQVTTAHKIWDGEHWVTHEGVVHNGYATTTALNGERFTEDHLIFVNERETKQVREILAGRQQCSEVPWRPLPGSNWKNVWVLARGIARAISQEWLSLLKSNLHSLWETLRRSVGKSVEGEDEEMQRLRSQRGRPQQVYQTMGERPR